MTQIRHNWARDEIGTRIAAFVWPNFGARIQVFSKDIRLMV